MGRRGSLVLLLQLVACVWAPIAAHGAFVCPDGWTANAASGVDACYKKLPDRMMRREAAVACALEGAYLTSIANEAENIFVNEKFSGCWLGLANHLKKTTSHPWEFDDGVPETYNNWLERNNGNDEPNNADHYCSKMKNDGFWIDFDCDDTRAQDVVCKMTEHTDKNAAILLAFKNSIDFDSSLDPSLQPLGTWVAGTSPCKLPQNYYNWEGVWCDPATMEVVRVSAINLGLKGPLPAHFTALGSMQVLRLYGNELTGTLPGDFTVWSDIRALRLNRNLLSGPLPAGWGTTFPLLRTLRLQSNRFTGTIPAEWGGMTSMRYMSLGWNSLVGTLPSELSTMTSLRSFRAAGNAYHDACPDAGYTFSSASGLPACYKYYSNRDFKRHADMAEQKCQEDGGHLVSLRSTTEEDYLRSWPAYIDDDKDTWIGLGYVTSDWAWMDGTPNTAGPMNWADSMPRADYVENDCVWLKKGNNHAAGWENKGRDNDLPFFCKLEVGLSGSLPEAWGSLVGLKKLLLDYNPYLDTTIPAEWSSLTQLET